MPRTTSSGTCLLCGKSYRKSGMTRHLQSCISKVGLPEEPGRGHAKSVHLYVEDDYRPEYWLHLALSASAKLYQLDYYLREIWLECCGHLSLFDIDKTFYCGDHVDLDPFGLSGLFGNRNPDRDMDVPLGRVAPPGVRFRYEYDFGTTSELNLRSVAEIAGPAGEINLLARNDPPAIDCSICGAPATWVTQSEDDWIAMTAGLCEDCAPNEDYRLPILNSPRSGVCGYDGATLIIIDDDEITE